MSVDGPPVLWAKMRVPATTEGLVERRRLVDAMVASAAPVWVVIAPAETGRISERKAAELAAA